MPAKILLIGLGHKARNGKDSVASFIKELRKKVFILHWADDLYAEVSNNNKSIPLVFRYLRYDQPAYDYYCLETPDIVQNYTIGTARYFVDPTFRYRVFHESEVPELHALFQKRDIGVYWGMEEKDGEMLQVWGTNIRRKFYGDNYWVDLLKPKIQNIKNAYENQTDDFVYILVPDTRFPNEVEAIADMNGLYVDVIRYNPDGTRYLAADRSNTHPSEVALDNHKSDYTISAQSGDMAGLKSLTEVLLFEIEMEKYGVKYEPCCSLV